MYNLGKTPLIPCSRNWAVSSITELSGSIAVKVNGWAFIPLTEQTHRTHSLLLDATPSASLNSWLPVLLWVSGHLTQPHPPVGRGDKEQGSSGKWETKEYAHTHTIKIQPHPANCKRSMDKCAYSIPSAPSTAVEWKYYSRCTHSTLHSGCLEPKLAAPPAELMPLRG